MDHERLLISKIITDQNSHEVSEDGLTAEHFVSATSRAAFRYITEFQLEHGTLPSERAFHNDNYGYRVEHDIEEPFSYLIGEVRKSHNLAVLEDALGKGIDLYDEGRDQDIIDVLRSAVERLTAESNVMQDVDVTTTAEERILRYETYRKRENKILGIPMGFPTIDNATLGFQPGQLITFVGPPKAGKSTLMLLAAKEAHRIGRKPLLIGFEMTNEEQMERLDAISAKVSLRRLREGRLSDDEMKMIRRASRGMEGLKPFILSNDSLNTSTLSGVAAKIDKYQPDLLIVDGVYMMQDEHGEKPGSPQALTNITRGFKSMATVKGIPIIIVTQVLDWKMDKKKGITAGSIGYSSSFAQDSTAIVGVESTEFPEIKLVKIVLSRNCPPCEVYVHWDYETGDFYETEDIPTDDSEGADY